MSDLHKSLRLGDLLVEKKLITRAQLAHALDMQKNRQTPNVSHKHIEVKTELGEILIELNVISRKQLQANLNWQRRLKATTTIMVFIAPLLTAACGGGAGGSGSTSASIFNTATETTSSQGLVNVSTKVDPSFNQSSSSILVSNFSSSSVSSSIVANKNIVDGAVQLYWHIPTQRENGDYLDVTEIGGYTLRYRLKGDDNYKSITIPDGFTDAYYFDYLKGEYEFQIATFDITGAYSNFIDINPS